MTLRQQVYCLRFSVYLKFNFKWILQMIYFSSLGCTWCLWKVCLREKLVFWVEGMRWVRDRILSQAAAWPVTLQWHEGVRTVWLLQPTELSATDDILLHFLKVDFAWIEMLLMYCNHNSMIPLTSLYRFRHWPHIYKLYVPKGGTVAEWLPLLSHWCLVWFFKPAGAYLCWVYILPIYLITLHIH